MEDKSAKFIMEQLLVCVLSCIATIKHPCVALLCVSNPILQRVKACKEGYIAFFKVDIKTINAHFKIQFFYFEIVDILNYILHSSF